MSFRSKVILCLVTSIFIFPNYVWAAQDSGPIEATRNESRVRERGRLSTDDLFLELAQMRRNLRDLAKENDALLTQLEAKASEHFERMKVLLHSDDGKRLVRDPVSFMMYVQLDRDPAVSLAELRRKREESSSLMERAALGEEGRRDVAYLPDEETQSDIYGLNFWVKDKLLRLQAQMDSLETVVSRHASGEDVSGAKTLAVALAEYNTLWQEVLAQSEILGKQLAQSQKQQILVDTNKLVEIDRARVEAERITAESNAQLAQQKQDYELRLLRQKTKLDGDRQRTEEALQKQIDDLKNELKIAQAKRELTNAKSDQQVEQIRTDTERQRIIATVQSPEFQVLLAPFIRDGYWQPNRTNRGYEQSPMSLQLIKKQNCLVPSTKGLQSLLTLGTNPANRERGPWTFPRRLQKLLPEQLDQLREAQQYLIDYGPIMVELGYLAP